MAVIADVYQASKLRSGSAWGRDDGAEIAVAGQTPGGKEQANNSFNHFFRGQTKAAIC